MPIEKHTYDKEFYNFKLLFCELIGIKTPELLHMKGGFETVGHTPGNDNKSEWSERFYNRMIGSYFLDCYNLFLKKVIRPQFDESIIFQKKPTLRISIPNGKGVAAYHIDTEYNHPKFETNVWLAITDAFGTNSIYIESEEGKGDYRPQNVKFGQYILFEGGKMRHGNEINTTGKTRISIDMRVIPKSKYVPSDLKGLAYGKVRSTEGKDAYYSIIQ